MMVMGLVMEGSWQANVNAHVQAQIFRISRLAFDILTPVFLYEGEMYPQKPAHFKLAIVDEKSGWKLTSGVLPKTSSTYEAASFTPDEVSEHTVRLRGILFKAAKLIGIKL